jgi:hypothetical protein
MSSPQSNSTQSSESPIALALRRRRTPARPPICASSGTVTFCSTSSAARPGASVSTTTVGALSSGKTSTGMRGTCHAASPTIRSAVNSTKVGCRSAERMRARNTAYSWSSWKLPSAWKWPPLLLVRELASSSS